MSPAKNILLLMTLHLWFAFLTHCIFYKHRKVNIVIFCMRPEVDLIINFPPKQPIESSERNASLIMIPVDAHEKVDMAFNPVDCNSSCNRCSAGCTTLFCLYTLCQAAGAVAPKKVIDNNSFRVLIASVRTPGCKDCKPPVTQCLQKDS